MGSLGCHCGAAGSQVETNEKHKEDLPESKIAPQKCIPRKEKVFPHTSDVEIG
jgi:hypothetical protein